MTPERPACETSGQTGQLTRSPVGQISPDKNMNLQCTTAAFTVSHEPEGFVILGSLASETRPCMRFLFVGSHLCTRASFAQPLAGLHLPSASGYHRYQNTGAGSPTGDLHPISSCPCRAYQVRGADKPHTQALASHTREYWHGRNI